MTRTVIVTMSMLLLVMLAPVFIGAIPVAAQECEGDFGCFDTTVPGTEIKKGESISDVASGDSPLVNLFVTISRIFIAVIVAAGLIMIVVAGYVYMTAGGNASRVGVAKGMVGGALLGIALALAAFLILNTLSPQFTTDLKEPEIVDPSA